MTKIFKECFRLLPKKSLLFILSLFKMGKKFDNGITISQRKYTLRHLMKTGENIL